MPNILLFFVPTPILILSKCPYEINKQQQPAGRSIVVQCIKKTESPQTDLWFRGRGLDGRGEKKIVIIITILLGLNRFVVVVGTASKARGRHRGEERRRRRRCHGCYFPQWPPKPESKPRVKKGKSREMCTRVGISEVNDNDATTVLLGHCHTTLPHYTAAAAGGRQCWLGRLERERRFKRAAAATGRWGLLGHHCTTLLQQQQEEGGGVGCGGLEWESGFEKISKNRKSIF